MVKVLVVEDNLQDIKLLRRAFEGRAPAPELSFFQNPEEALRALEADGSGSARPDVILLDIMLPEMSGIEFLKRIRTRPETQRVPVVMFTTSTNEKDVRESYESGATGYIAKPMTFDEYLTFARVFTEYWCGLVRFPT